MTPISPKRALDDFDPDLVKAVQAARRRGTITMETLGVACEANALTKEEIDTLLALVKALGIEIIETDPALSPAAEAEKESDGL